MKFQCGSLSSPPTFNSTKPSSKGKEVAGTSGSKRQRTATTPTRDTHTIPKKLDPTYQTAKQFTKNKPIGPNWRKFEKREVISEKRYLYSEIYGMMNYTRLFFGYKDFFSSRRLDALLAPITSGFPTLTKLWYAGMSTHNDKIYIKIGDFIIEDFTAETINKTLGIVTDEFPLPDDCISYPTEFTKAEIHEAIYYCYNTESKSATITTKSLLKNNFLIFLYEFINSNLVPQKGNHNNPTRMLEEILYIVSTKKVNIGQIILSHMFHILHNDHLVLPYPCLIIRILLFSGYELPAVISEHPCTLKIYGHKAFGKMYNAGRKSRQEGKDLHDNLQHGQTSRPPPSQPPPSQSSQTPPPIKTPLHRLHTPGVSMDDMKGMFAGLQIHMDARLDGMFTRFEQRFNSLDTRLDHIDQRIVKLEDFSRDMREEVESARIATSEQLGEMEATQMDLRTTQLEMQTFMSEMDAGQRYIWENVHTSGWEEKIPTYDAICERGNVTKGDQAAAEDVEESSSEDESDDEEEDKAKEGNADGEEAKDV